MIVENLPLGSMERLRLGWDDIREARGLARLVDPFDRLIAASAVRLDVPLITGDERIRGSGLVRTVW